MEFKDLDKMKFDHSKDDVWKSMDVTRGSTMDLIESAAEHFATMEQPPEFTWSTMLEQVWNSRASLQQRVAAVFMLGIQKSAYDEERGGRHSRAIEPKKGKLPKDIKNLLRKLLDEQED